MSKGIISTGLYTDVHFDDDAWGFYSRAVRQCRKGPFGIEIAAFELDEEAFSQGDVYGKTIGTALALQVCNGLKLTSSARMCLFFWLKNFEGSERVLKVNFMYSEFNLGPQSPVFFSGTRILRMGDFFVFFVFFQDGYHGFDLA